MNNSALTCRALILALLSGLSVARAQVTYETDFTNSGYGTNASITWGTANGGGRAVWNDSVNAGSGNGSSWVNGAAGAANNAVFGKGTGTLSYTATLDTNISVGTIAVVNGTWSIALSTFTLTFDSSTNYSLAMAISGTGGITKINTNTLTLTGPNTHSGTTAINAGVLALGSSGALSTSAGTISFGGGTLQFSSSNTNDYSARFSTAASQQYKIDTNGQNVTFASALTSSGATLAKSGGGTLTLSGSNTYIGGTSVSGGILKLGATSALPSATAVSLSGATLELGTTGTFATSGTLSVASNPTIDFGALGASSLTFASGQTGATGYAAGTWTGTGSVFLTVVNYNQGTDTLRFGSDNNALTNSQLQSISINGFMAQWAASNGTIEPSLTAIPEPSTYAALAGVGALGLAVYRRRQARETSKLAVTASV